VFRTSEGDFEMPAVPASTEALAVGLMAGSSVLKRHTDEIALTPDHAALANGVKFVEAQFEIRRQQIEAMKLNSGTGIGDVLNPAGEDTALGIKEQQRVFRDRRPRDRAAFEFHRSYQQFTPTGSEASKLRPVGNQLRSSL
jgi:hypothetical protein